MSVLLRDFLQFFGGIYVFVVLLRFLSQLAMADPHNPLLVAIVRATKWPTRYLRLALPPWRNFDGASLLWAWLVQLGMLLALAWLPPGLALRHDNIYADALALLAHRALDVCFIALVVTVIASFLAPFSRHPALQLAHQLIEPLLAPIRRVIPPVAGLDFSPLILFFVVSVVRKFV